MYYRYGADNRQEAAGYSVLLRQPYLLLLMLKLFGFQSNEPQCDARVKLAGLSILVSECVGLTSHSTHNRSFLR